MLRDKRTIIAMVVVPIVVMPLLSLGVFSIMMIQMKKIEEKPIKIGIVNYSESNLVQEEIEAPDENDKVLKVQFIKADNEEDLKEKLNNKEIQIGLIINEDLTEKLKSNESSELIIVYDQSREVSQMARRKISAKIRTFRDIIRDERLKGIGLSDNFIYPIKLTYHDLSTPKKIGAFIIGMLLPYMLIILSVAGAANPAMDITAGEKERGTLETILVSPASITEITFGKFFTIQAVSIISTFLILASYFVFLKLGLFATMADMQLKINIPFKSLALILFLFLPISGMFSALLLTISIYAKSMKEAQSYMAPIMIGTIFPAMISLLPGIDHSVLLSFIPIMNISLTIKGIIMDDFNLLYYSLTFLASTAYALICLFIAMNIFKRESVLFRA